MGALNNAEVGKYVGKYFVAAFQKVGTFKVVGKQKQGGNVAAYFCAPDGRVLHAVAGPVSAAVMLRELKWTVETTEKAIKEAKKDGAKFKEMFRAAHAARLKADHGLVVEPVTHDPVELDPGHVNGFSAHFDWPSHSWVFDWTWDTSRIILLGGGELLGVDHVEVHAENVQTEFTSFDTVTMAVAGPPTVTVTHELIETIVEECPCDVALPFGQLDFSDVIGFLQCFSGACP